MSFALINIIGGMSTKTEGGEQKSRAADGSGGSGAWWVRGWGITQIRVSKLAGNWQLLACTSFIGVMLLCCVEDSFVVRI